MALDNELVYKGYGNWIKIDIPAHGLVFNKILYYRPYIEVFTMFDENNGRRIATVSLAGFYAYRDTEKRNSENPLTLKCQISFKVDGETETIYSTGKVSYSDLSDNVGAPSYFSGSAVASFDVPDFSFKDFLSDWSSGKFSLYSENKEKDILTINANVSVDCYYGDKKMGSGSNTAPVVIYPFKPLVPHLKESVVKINNTSAKFSFCVESAGKISDSYHWFYLPQLDWGFSLYKKTDNGGSQYLDYIETKSYSGLYLESEQECSIEFEGLDVESDYVILLIHPEILIDRINNGLDSRDKYCTSKLYGFCEQKTGLPLVNVVEDRMVYDGEYKIKYNGYEYCYDAPLFRVEFSVSATYVENITIFNNKLDCDNTFYEHGFTISPTSWTTQSQYFTIENMTPEILEVQNMSGNNILVTEEGVGALRLSLKGLKFGDGKLRITPAKQADNKTDSFEVLINCFVPAKNLLILDSPVPIYVGEKVSLRYSIESHIGEPSTDNNIVITSNNDEFCKIFDNTLYGVAEGSTTINVELLRRSDSKNYNTSIIESNIPITIYPARQPKEMPDEKSNTLKFDTISSLYVNLILIKDKLVTLNDLAQIIDNATSPTLEVVDVSRGFRLTPDELLSEIEKLETDIKNVGEFVEDLVDAFNAGKSEEEQIKKLELSGGDFADNDDSFDFVLSRFRYCNFLISATDRLLKEYIARQTENTHARNCGGDILYAVAKSKSDKNASLKNTLIPEKMFFNVVKGDGSYAGVSGYTTENLTEGISGVWEDLSEHGKPNAISLTFAVKPGDKIYSLSMKNNSENGGSDVTGTPMVFFKDEKPIYSLGSGSVNYLLQNYYNKEYVSVPDIEEINAVNIILWSEDQALYLWKED